tara:strand:- start:379 stop:621 length:243 start_codon:yes stop_codon:yes gene_type:complete
MIENPRKYWTDKVAKTLEGRTIIKIEYMPEEEVKDMLWHKIPVVIHLDDGGILVPSMDDEGNDGGAIITNYWNLETIPVI